MKRIYIDRADTTISVVMNRLVVKHKDDARGTSCPVKQVESIVITRKTDLASSTLLKLAKHNIDVLCINPRNFDGHTMTSHFQHGNYARTFKQISFIQDKQNSLAFAKHILRLKLKQQLLVLKKILRKRPNLSRPMFVAISHFNNASQAVEQCEQLDALRGIEGSAAAQYFAAYTCAFAKSLNFTHRNRRPPKDPVNSVLSLGYTLLHGDCVRALTSKGLDARFGVMHSLSYNRNSLACDLVEVFRGKYDYQVWRWFATQTFRDRDFGYVNNACILEKSAKNKFFFEFEVKAINTRKRMRRLVSRWVKLLDSMDTRND